MQDQRHVITIVAGVTQRCMDVKHCSIFFSFSGTIPVLLMSSSWLDGACTAQPYQIQLQVPKRVRPESQGGHTDVRTKHKYDNSRWQTTGLTVSANLHTTHVPP